MLLVIDAGNTRMKWAIFDQAGHITASGHHLTADIAVFRAPGIWAGVKKATIANVASQHVGSCLTEILDTLQIHYRFAKVQAEARGVVNEYQDVHQLGVDRWAALLATKQQYGAPAVIVSAGTAITIDMLAAREDGKSAFIGGLILPGINLMIQGLQAGTARLPADIGQLVTHPLNTQDCIHSGTMHAVAGAVRFMLERLQYQSDSPCCVITGGQAETLAEALQFLDVAPRARVHVAGDLVLRGLFLLESAA